MASLPVGKLRAEMLERLFACYLQPDERVIVGPRVGEDAAVIDLGDRFLVASTDPITFSTDALGWYALHVNANDVAVRGAAPRWFLATLLLPEGGASAEMVEAIFADLADACRDLGVTLVGGHTEVTAGLPRPLLVGAMLGEVHRDRLVTTRGAQVGDLMLLTKGVPLEGAAIIARERREEAERRGVAPDVVARAGALLRDPGISVVRDARLACGVASVHAMHDPTEGGLATACWEMAQAGEVGLRVRRDRIRIIPEGEQLCRAFGLDPLGTIASGALLLAVAPAEADAVIAACGSAGLWCDAIAEVVARDEGVTIGSAGRYEPLPTYAQDEIIKLFGTGSPDMMRANPT
jgi:hydrogenase expression/formation protein HypE